MTDVSQTTHPPAGPDYPSEPATAIQPPPPRSKRVRVPAGDLGPEDRAAGPEGGHPDPDDYAGADDHG